MRSIVLSVLCVLVLASNMQEAEAFAVSTVGILQRVLSRGRSKPVAAPPLAPPKDIAASFDTSFADSLRKDMTELVYERSMERLHVN